VDAGSLIEAIDARAPEALERHGVSGLAVGVRASGEDVLRAYGGARPETAFRVASITKPLVAALALRLVEEGRLALDEPIAGLRLPWDGITLRHLLSHQGGLACDWPRSLDEYGEGDDALRRLAAEEAMGGPVGPGELFSYSNLGYWLAGAVIERAAGAGFEDALQRLVLGPLGMERTDFSPSEPFVPGTRPYPRARRPAGGLYSCAGDLLRFARHLLGGPGPLAPDSLREIQAPQVAHDPAGDYGLGLFLWRGRGRPTIEHGGMVHGFRSLLVLVPAEDAAVVLLAAGDLGRLVVEELLQAVDLGLKLPAEVSVAHERLSSLAATYRDPLGAVVVVTVREGGLDLAGDESDGAGPFSVHLRPAAAEWFVGRDGDDCGESADFPRGGELLRYGWLFERVAD